MADKVKVNLMNLPGETEASYSGKSPEDVPQAGEKAITRLKRGDTFVSAHPGWTRYADIMTVVSVSTDGPFRINATSHNSDYPAEFDALGLCRDTGPLQGSRIIYTGPINEETFGLPSDADIGDLEESLGAFNARYDPDKRLRPALEAAAMDFDATIGGFSAQDAALSLIANWLDTIADYPSERLDNLQKDVDDVVDQLSRFQQRVQAIATAVDPEQDHDDEPGGTPSP